MIQIKNKNDSQPKEIIALYKRLENGAIRTYTSLYRGARLIWEAALRIWKGKQVWKGKEKWKY